MRANLIRFRKQQEPTNDEISKRPEGSKKYKGLLQYEQAKRLDITRQHYSRIESGLNDPSIGLLERFSNVYPDVPDLWDIFKKK